MAYVYEHWRPDTNVCFYVGKGTGGRAGLLSRRNRYHKAVRAVLTSAGLDIEVRIIADGMTDEEAFALEEERIAMWRAQGTKLANSSSGGRGGTAGIKRSEESKRKQSETATGRKLSPEHYQKLVDRVRSAEARKANSLIHTGRKRPPETGTRISDGLKAAWAADPDKRERQSIALSGRSTSDATKEKQRAAKTPEIRTRLSILAKEQWNKPGERERRCAAMSVSNAGRTVSEAARESARKAMTPERRASSSAELKKRWEDPVARQEMSAALSAARTGRSLSQSHIDSLKKSWTPERRKSVSDKLKQIRAERKDWGK